MFNNLYIIILAGGMGRRMQSDLPKVLHKINNVPMIVHIIEEVTLLQPEKIIVVCGEHLEQISSTIYDSGHIVEYAYQSEPLGTGHAVLCCIEQIAEVDKKVLIICGDTPLINHDMLYNFINNDCQMIATRFDNPSGYGRVICNESGQLVKIVEHKDCTEEELCVNMVNSGIYCLESQSIVQHIENITNDNAQEEYYLPDLLNLIVTAGKDVNIFILDKSEQNQLLGINTPEQLEVVSKLMMENL
jgi:bifunctional UDP-N-acetylglucosamine pyrophosphorylase / glucosamine-1-phosphate N-acetyltransferase